MAARWLPPFAQPPPGYRIDWDAVGLPRPIAQWRFNVPGSSVVPDVERTGLHAYITGQSAGSVWVTTPWGPATQLASSPAAAWVVQTSQPLNWSQGMAVAAHVIFPDSWVSNMVIASKCVTIWQWQMQTSTIPDKWSYRNGGIFAHAAIPNGAAAWIGKPTVIAGWNEGEGSGGIVRVGMWSPDGLSSVGSATMPSSSTSWSNDLMAIGNRSSLSYSNYTGPILCVTLWQVPSQLGLAEKLAGPLPMWVPQRYWMFGATAGTTVAIPWHLFIRRID